jgi:hypothetical protein
MQSSPTNFVEWMNALGPGERVPLLFIGSILGVFALVFTVTIISIIVYGMHKNRLADALKRELMERGMSAEEIATVISAKPNINRR